MITPYEIMQKKKPLNRTYLKSQPKHLLGIIVLHPKTFIPNATERFPDISVLLALTLITLAMIGGFIILTFLSCLGFHDPFSYRQDNK